jgi:hypothetical protein
VNPTTWYWWRNRQDSGSATLSITRYSRWGFRGMVISDSGHRDHRSDDYDQLIGIIPERVIGIIPERVIGIVRNPQDLVDLISRLEGRCSLSEEPARLPRIGSTVHQLCKNPTLSFHSGCF